MEYEPENEKIYFNLGMLTMDDRQYTDSEKWFQKSIKVNTLNVSWGFEKICTFLLGGLNPVQVIESVMFIHVGSVYEH